MKILIFISLFLSPLFASEVDSFHHRFDSLKDATDSINQYSNDLFDKVLEKSNNSENRCDENKLYKNLRKEFHNILSGSFNKYISNSIDIERIRIKTANSIYGDFTARDSVVLGFYSKYITDPLATAINIHGHFVGTDKFEHFAGTGFVYFKNHYLHNKSIEETLNIGERAENGILGAYTTGVISYGDMSAEFNGMRFWNHILAKNPDILSVNLGPYVECKNNQWIKVKPIDFSQYVDDAWDEGINCSKLRTKKMLEKVKASIMNLEEETGRVYTCPMDNDASLKSIIKYGPYANKIINTRLSSTK